MEYKRLTTEKEYGCGLCNDRKCKKPNLFCKDRLDCEIYNRLAELEDKIEQGTLIELPCKVGDIVFTIEGGIIEEHEVMGILLQFDEIFFKILRKRDLVCKFWGSRSVFLTREEAEKRLKELQNGR